MKQRMMQFMRGRYGTDQFSNFLMWSACILVFSNIFLKNGIINLIAIFIFLYAYARVFSRNIVRRSGENTWFLNKTYKIRMRLRKEQSHMLIRKTHHIYSCPECRQKIKIPRGKGKIEIRCPKCGCRFIKRS